MSNVDATGRFGIYILTYPGDYHLSTVLVESIKRLNPDVPLMIIPGEGFEREDHPFDIPIMSEPTGDFWRSVGYQDRKIWAFQGPFETFLYLDADTICTKSLDKLIERILRQEGKFIYVQPWTDDKEWRKVVRDPSHPDHEQLVRNALATVGKLPLMEFDPEHDFLAHSRFNSGVFASRRLTITEADFESLNRAEREFYRKNLGINDWTWHSSDVFFRDQGRLNYLIDKRAVPVFPLSPELICRAGGDAVSVALEEVEQGTCDFHVVHWTGTFPSPSFFSRMPLFRFFALFETFVGRRRGQHFSAGYEWLQERVAYSVWRKYYEELFGPMSLWERLAWSWKDLKRLSRLVRRSFKLVARSLRN